MSEIVVVRETVAEPVVVLEAQGPPGVGTPGTDGASAYEIAVENGFVGTEAEWLTSLEGEDGAPGDSHVPDPSAEADGRMLFTEGGALVYGDAPEGGGGGGPVAWADVTGKPTEFPPEDHTHVLADVTDFDGSDYATAAQGAKADTATQPADLATGLATKANTSHTHAEADVTGLTAALAGKVPTSRTVNGEALSGDVTLDSDDISDTGKTHKFTTAGDITKLAGIATGATANDTDANLKARANHTGTQTLSTISDAGTAAALNVPTSGDATSGQVVKGNDSRLTNSRTPTSHTHGVSDLTATGTPSSTTYLRGDNTWATPAGGASLSRTTATYTTGSLAANATETGTVSLGTGWLLVKIATDYAARVQLYVNSTYRTADASRLITTSPVGDHGVIVDAHVDGTTLMAIPGVVGFPDASSVALRITNRSGTTHAIATTFTIVQLVA